VTARRLKHALSLPNGPAAPVASEAAYFSARSPAELPLSSSLICQVIDIVFRTSAIRRLMGVPDD
jgi:hypothetical protein